MQYYYNGQQSQAHTLESNQSQTIIGSKQLSALSSHLECSNELFQGVLMEVFLVKEQQQLKNTPVRTSENTLIQQCTFNILVKLTVI